MFTMDNTVAYFAWTSVMTTSYINADILSLKNIECSIWLLNSKFRERKSNSIEQKASAFVTNLAKYLG